MKLSWQVVRVTGTRRSLAGAEDASDFYVGRASTSLHVTPFLAIWQFFGALAPG